MRGSFSSVSKPIFAIKYSFCSIFRDLQDFKTFAPLQIQKFTLKSSNFFARLNIEYSIFCIFRAIFAISRPNVDEILSEFHQNFQKMTKSVKSLRIFHENIQKIPEISSQICRISEIIQFCDSIIQFPP